MKRLMTALGLIFLVLITVGFFAAVNIPALSALLCMIVYPIALINLGFQAGRTNIRFQVEDRALPPRPSESATEIKRRVSSVSEG